jgi:hypothetical protein
MKGQKPTKAGRGAYQLAAKALRNEVRRLDKLAKEGVAVDPEQRAILAALADRAALIAVAGG